MSGGVKDRQRFQRLLRESVHRLELDLTGIAVLTEAASGPFVATPLGAALAGGTVVAVVRDSVHGPAKMVAEHTMAWADEIGVADRVHVHVGRAEEVAQGCSLVTNTGFVRPIDAAVLDLMAPDAGVALMVEPWELRPADVDLEGCALRGIPAAGTNERHPDLRIFEYLGPLAARLLFELDVEVFRARLLVVGSDPFGSEIAASLRRIGADVSRRDSVADPGSLTDIAFEGDIRAADAVVLAEYRTTDAVIGGSHGIPVDWLTEPDVPIAHICGTVPDDAAPRLRKTPSGLFRPGHMAATTAYLGPRPVVDLHIGGLRVGELLVRARRDGLSPLAAVERAVAAGIGLPVQG